MRPGLIASFSAQSARMTGEVVPHFVIVLACELIAAVRVLRMLQHERALKIPGAVQPRGQPEMPFEQCARAAEQIKKLVGNGYREIVLTGVDITSYGPDLPGTPTLGKLVQQILRRLSASKTAIKNEKAAADSDS